MTRVTAQWRDDDDRGPVCELTGTISDEKFWEIQRLFARSTGLVPKRTLTVEREPMRFIVTSVPVRLSLRHRDSLLRIWLVSQIEQMANISTNGLQPTAM